MDDIAFDDRKHKRDKRSFLSVSWQQLAAVGLVAVLGVCLGVLIGYFSRGGTALPTDSWEYMLTHEGPAWVSQRLIDDISAANIEENLRLLTQTTRLAGTASDLQGAQYIRDRWLADGLDHVMLTPYDVALSYPTTPNTVTMVAANGTVVFTGRRIEEGFENDPDAVTYYSAYSPPGEAEGDLVFANHGSMEDFQYLVDQGVDLAGKIVIVKYGAVGRGDKAVNAEKFGALGVIVYSDPGDYGNPDGPNYPETWFLSGSGVQRGSLNGDYGDLLTPGYPAKEYAYRTDINNITATGLASIPTQPIGWEDAATLMRHLSGPAAPSDWQGGLGFNYSVGPGFVGPYANRKVHLKVTNQNVLRRTYNVIGTIRGSVEPDRYVLYGNHRDGWVYGAVDPTSGTACMLEIIRVLGALVKSGSWRPKRTIVFGSWGSEEFGLIGSTEWAEEYVKTLTQRAVAYINVDIAVMANDTMRVRGSKLLQTAIFDATKKVPSHERSLVSDAGNRKSRMKRAGLEKSLYETMVENTPNVNGQPAETPRFLEMGRGSDYVVFYHRLGIPSVDLMFVQNREKPGVQPVPIYPAYHTAFDTFDYVKRFIDPEFKAHQAVARVAIETVRVLSDSMILPFDLLSFADKMQAYLTGVQLEHGEVLTAQGVSLEYLESAVTNFTSAAVRLERKIGDVNKLNPLDVRALNDKLLYLERAFIDPLGLPGPPFLWHVAAGFSRFNSSSAAFPSLTDAILDDSIMNPEQRLDAINKRLSVITFIIQSAASILTEAGMES
ncbi:aminopeptidase NAALADL1-like [Branchiostoma floridae]|uniref:Aminopeptidase NAALADL1-like n=1 Tax=Branchiostoma floridae TaxID=7739 RepID=A0A9J7KVQ8_BRAFL|nr:aminopeptidase NAALADL1-like [Branchiostoma floridae]